jgi:hypothetical protein
MNDMTALESMSSKIIKLLEQASPWFLQDESEGNIIQCPPSGLHERRFYVMGFHFGMSKHGGQSAAKSLRKRRQPLIAAAASNSHPLSG